MGLKGSTGTRGAQPRLLTTYGAYGSAGANLLSRNTFTTFGGSSNLPVWPALWGAVPSPSTNPYINSATQSTPNVLSGRSSTILTTRAGLYRSGAKVPFTTNLGGGDSTSPLTDILAKLAFSKAGTLSSAIRPRQGYLPLSSNISASRRLRVTKGITLPSDTPIHIICGSKDVIHSWAIPGLGIKIDCIPGYNSHRRLLLRWRGAYWGQCMEVCGRYHHWMPIMVNVAHPALFIDWCLTFLRGLDTQSQNGASSLPPFDVAALIRAVTRN
jgi:hypothetical protein